jgi:hypothetical protein
LTGKIGDNARMFISPEHRGIADEHERNYREIKEEQPYSNAGAERR